MDCRWHGNHSASLPRRLQLLRYEHKEFSGLHLACKMDNSDEVERLINNEADLHTVLSNDVAGCTPLHVAITYNRPKIIKILLKKGSDFALKDDINETPLHIAFKQYSRPSIQLILQAYYTACSRINENIKEALAMQNFPIDTSISVHDRFLVNFRPLHFAVTFQLVDIIPILLDHGIDIRATDSNGMTALHYAIQHTQTGLLQTDYLHKVLTEMSYAKRDTIFLDNLIKIIDLLLYRGSDVNALDNSGKSPMFYLFDRLSNGTNSKENYEVDLNYSLSVFIARKTVIRRLLLFNPNLLIKDNEGNTILHLMAKAGDDYFYVSYELAIADRYLLIGGDVNELNNAGHSVLHYACESGYKDLVDLMLSNGAEVNLTRSEDRERPIHAAVRYLSQATQLSMDSQIAMILQLLQCGAYVDAEMTDGTTPILLATSPKHYASNIPLILCLFNWGCNVNCADADGRTPLHNICQLKYLRLIEDFLWHGADVNALDAQGNTPFSIVFRWRSFDLLNSLDVYSCLKKLSILGAPLCQANRDLYAYLQRMKGNMLEVGKSILQKRMFEEERTVYWSDYMQKLSEVPTEEQCRAELELMKTIRIDGDLTLYDILHKNSKLSYYPRSEHTNILADTYLDEDYPVYSYLVKAKLRTTSKDVLLNRSTQLMKKIFQADMPDVFNRIFSHLRHDDFVHFTQAFVPEKNKDETESTLEASAANLG